MGGAFSTWKYKIVIDCKNCTFWTPNSSSLTIPCIKAFLMGFVKWETKSIGLYNCPTYTNYDYNHLKICDVAKTMFFWVAKFHYFCDFSRRKTWETIWKSEKWVFFNKQFAKLAKSHIWGEKHWGKMAFFIRKSSQNLVKIKIWK